MSDRQKILVTGGAGYIGSTVCSALSEQGHVPIILDSLVSGPREFTQGHIFYEGDIADTELLGRIFAEHPEISCTMHFAARISVTESVSDPALYYTENVSKSITLFEELVRLGQKRVIFSSSASIYASPADLGQADFKVDESAALRPLSPYARTKWMMEMVLQDICQASELKAIALRYFNPIGADPKLRTGPYASEPSHILGRLVATSQGKYPFFGITGTDYPTRDGTGLRDYIPVWDLALAHTAALEHFDTVFEQYVPQQSFVPINVGTGNGVTVREFVEAFQHVSPNRVEVRELERRPGDSAGAYADTSKAREWLGWQPTLSTTEALASVLAWSKQQASKNT